MNKIKGFTLVELLVVIAVIAILFAVVLVAINPAQRFKDSRNARRLSDVQSIVNSVVTYTADAKGVLPANMPDGQCIGSKQAVDFGATAPTGTRSYWQMTTVNDTTDGLTNIAANNLTLDGGALVASGGVFGNGLLLNGIRQDAMTANQTELQLNSPITIETWFRLSKGFEANQGVSQGILNKGDYNLTLSNRTGALEFEMNPNTADSATLAYGGSKYAFSSFAEYNGVLYAGQGNTTGDGVIYQSSNGTSWSASSFPGAQESIFSLAAYKGKLYAGQGSGSGDGVVFSYDGTTNNYGLGANGWKTEYSTGADGVYALYVWSGKLYAGVGGAANSAEVYEFDGTSWKQLNLSYANDVVFALVAWNGKLYAATGGANRAQALAWNGSSWSQDYIHATKNYAYSLAVYQRNLYVGIGGSLNSAAEVRVTTDGSVWNISDANAARDTRSMTVYDGKLYAGLGGSTAVYRKIRVFDGTSWLDFYTGIGGDNSESIRALSTFKGKLFAAELGDALTDGDMYSFGSTTVLQSNKVKWNASQWYHVAVTYDGSTAIIYINGYEDNRTSVSLTLANQNTPLYIGYNGSDGFFEGLLDNVILYQQALSATTIADHAGCYNLAQTIVPAYMAKMPVDPSSTVTDGTDTGYQISQTGGVVTVTAPLTEISGNTTSIIKNSR